MKRKRSGLPSWLHRRQTGGGEVASSFVGECGMTTNMVARLGLCRELEVSTYFQARVIDMFLDTFKISLSGPHWLCQLHSMESRGLSLGKVSS